MSCTRAAWAVVAAALAALGPLASAQADDSKIQWEEIIGIIQAGNLVGSGTGQVAGGGQPWSTLGGRASVDLATGRVKFKVEGLVLAGGNGIGTTGGVSPVVGTLVCDTNGSAGGGNSVLVNTDPVPLDALGNAEFDGVVDLPAVCSSEPDIAFLVRIVANQRWIANGAVRR